jgi:ABC-type Fe3+ transport system permease subunit
MEDQNYQTYTETQKSDSTPLYTVQPKKKSNTWWIILLVVLLVLCCCIMIVGVVVLFLVASGQYRIDWTMLTPILSFI